MTIKINIPTLTIENETVKFMYNGIKVGKTLFKGWFSFNTTYEGIKVVTFYADGYDRIPDVIRNTFTVKNETDTMTDYFDKDRFQISPDSIYFNAALIAALKNKEKHVNVLEKRIETNHKCCRTERDKKYYREQIDIIKSEIDEILKKIK